MDPIEFRHEPAADFPGWDDWDVADQAVFNPHAMGRLLVRQETAAGGQPVSRLRMFPARQHSNVQHTVHGGATLALIDISLFAAFKLLLGGHPGNAVTLDLSTQFIGTGHLGEPLDAVVEVLRETGRLAFMRGLVVQGDNTIAAFAGTVRKPSVK